MSTPSLAIRESGLDVAEVANVDPVIGAGLEALADRIVAFNSAIIGEHLDLAAVVDFEQFRQSVSDGVLSKVRGDISDPDRLGARGRSARGTASKAARSSDLMASFPNTKASPSWNIGSSVSAASDKGEIEARGDSRETRSDATTTGQRHLALA